MGVDEQPGVSRGRRMVGRALWVVYAPGLVLLLAAWFTPARLDDDGDWFAAWSYVAFMVRTFTFHGAIGLGVLALLAWAVKARRLAVAAGLVSALIVVPALVHPWNTGKGQNAGGAGQDDTLTILSTNIRHSTSGTRELLEQVATEKPDMIVLQEYSARLHDTLHGELIGEFPHCFHARGENYTFGQVVYSRRGFVEPPEVLWSAVTPGGREFAVGNGPQVQCRVLLAGRPVTVRVVHTHRPGNLWSFREMRRQIALMARQAEGRSEPLILAGDFNATNNGAPMSALREGGMRDALDTRAVGRGCTWPDLTILKYAPGIRIDHVMYSPELECEWSRVGNSTGSDHLPVTARLRVKSRRQ